MPRKTTPAYLEKNCGYATPCWIWQWSIRTDGYGNAHRIIEGTPRRWQTISAHRVYWERENGPLDPGLELDHLCKIITCCNPAHLEPVTRLEHARRSPRVKLTETQRAEIALSSEPTRTLAKRMGVAYRTIQNWRPGVRAGEVRVAPFKIPLEERAVIAASTEPNSVLARRYGVTVEGIRIYRIGSKSYSH